MSVVCLNCALVLMVLTSFEVFRRVVLFLRHCGALKAMIIALICLLSFGYCNAGFTARKFIVSYLVSFIVYLTLHGRYLSLFRVRTT